LAARISEVIIAARVDWTVGTDGKGEWETNRESRLEGGNLRSHDIHVIFLTLQSLQGIFLTPWIGGKKSADAAGQLQGGAAKKRKLYWRRRWWCGKSRLALSHQVA
jgi:hypothetical protein